MASIFFAYSHRDEALRNQLEVQLKALQRQGLIDTWHDRRIEAGQDWEDEIRKNLEAADVILLLISPDFIASDYCYDTEMGRALERHEEGSARVIPVILRHCDWKELPFASLQATPPDGKPVTSYPDRDQAFLQVTLAIKSALRETGAELVQPHVRRESVSAGSSEASAAEQPTSPSTGPRSSNLRIRQEFSQRDRDQFLRKSFELIAQFFENSLGELEERHDSIETDFRRVDANSFTAVVYRDGSAEAQCRISIGSGGLAGLGGSGIFCSDDLDAPSRGSISYNEHLTVGADDQKLYLRPLMKVHMREGDEDHLTQVGAAEYLWARLIDRLQ